MIKLESIVLSDKDIQVAKFQSAIKFMGFQWNEHQFNDGHNDVYIRLTKRKDARIFRNGEEEVGWGRMGRFTAWKMAYEWALQVHDKTKR